MIGAIPLQLMPNDDTVPLGPADEISCAVDRYAASEMDLAFRDWEIAQQDDAAFVADCKREPHPTYTDLLAIID